MLVFRSEEIKDVSLADRISQNNEKQPSTSRATVR